MVKKVKSSKAKQRRWTDTLSVAEREVYEERTRRLAALGPEEQTLSNLVTFIRFRLGNKELYGLPYSHIEKIVYARDITVVPTTPAFIAGVINYSGEMLTVLDSKVFFGREHSEPGADARIIVIRGNELTVGLLVDEIQGYDNFDPSQLSPALQSESESSMRYVKGIHQGSITIIDLPPLLMDQAIRVG